MTAASAERELTAAAAFATTLAARVSAGARFAGLFGTAIPASPSMPRRAGVRTSRAGVALAGGGRSAGAGAERGGGESSARGRESAARAGRAQLAGNGALLLSAHLAAGGELETVEAVVPPARPGTRR